MLWRELQRGDTFLIRGARIFVGDGRVIESGSVLVRNGKIDEVYDGAGPEPDAEGRGGRGVGQDGDAGPDRRPRPPRRAGRRVRRSEGLSRPSTIADRALAQYLYSGVTTVKSAGDRARPVDRAARADRARRAASAPNSSSPARCSRRRRARHRILLVAEGRRRRRPRSRFVRTPKSPERGAAAGARAEGRAASTGSRRCSRPAARASVRAAGRRRAKAVVRRGRAQRLPLVGAHRRRARRRRCARRRRSGIEHGSFAMRFPTPCSRAWRRPASPTIRRSRSWRPSALCRPAGPTCSHRSLVQQAVSPKLLTGTRNDAEGRHGHRTPTRPPASTAPRARAGQSQRAWEAGVTLVTGSDAGNMLVFHGPTVQHELQLWVEAGIPPAVALQAATWNAARLLRADAPHRPRRQRPRRRPADRRRQPARTSRPPSASRSSCSRASASAGRNCSTPRRIPCNEGTLLAAAGLCSCALVAQSAAQPSASIRRLDGSTITIAEADAFARKPWRPRTSPARRSRWSIAASSPGAPRSACGGSIRRCRWIATTTWAASITKVVFATYVMQLAERGELSLDTQIAAQLPNQLDAFDEYRESASALVRILGGRPSHRGFCWPTPQGWATSRSSRRTRRCTCISSPAPATATQATAST